MLVYLSVQKSTSYLWSDIKCNCTKTTWQHSLSVSKSQGDTTISSNSWWRHYQILGRNCRLRYGCCWRKVCSTCCIKFWNICKIVKNIYVSITYINSYLQTYSCDFLKVLILDMTCCFHFLLTMWSKVHFNWHNNLKLAREHTKLCSSQIIICKIIPFHMV